MINEFLSHNLLSIREQSGLSQRDFAKKCNLKETTYGDLERGVFNEERDSYKLERIAKALYINKETLYTAKNTYIINMDSSMDNLSERFKKIRQDGNYTKKEFAKLIDIPLTTYWDWEVKGIKPKDIDLLLEIADYLEEEFCVKRAWFLFNKGHMYGYERDNNEEESL